MRKKSRNSRRALSPTTYSSLISVLGGQVWHGVIVAVVVFVAGLSVWLDPGVTRPYPGFTVLLGGICAVLAGLTFPLLAVSYRSRATVSVLLCLLLWLVACCPGSLDPFRSLQTLASWVGAAGLFLLVSLSTSSGLRWYLVVLGLTTSASGLCLYGFSHLDPKVGLSSTFSNADSFSVVPMLALFLALSITSHPAAPIRLFGWAQAILFGLTLVRTTSRSAMIGLVVGMGVMAILIGLQGDSKKTTRVRRMSLLLPLVILLVALPTGLLSQVSGRFSDLAQGKDIQGVSMREDVLIHGLKASFAHPLLGSGPGTFALSYQDYRPQGVLPDYMYVNVAHNDYVEVAVELGWPGFCLLVLLYFLVFLKAIRLLKHDQGPWEACCCASGVAALLAFSLFNFVASIPCLLFWDFTVLALLHSIPTVPSATPNRVGVKLLVQALILILLGGWATNFGWRSYRAEGLAQEADSLLVALRWEEALPKLDSALKLQPENPNWYLARGMLKARQRQLAGQKPAPEVDDDFETAWHLSPRDLKVSRGVINYYESTGRIARAETVLEEINKHRPYVASRHRELSRLQFLQGKFLAAAETVHAGLADDAELKTALVPALVGLESMEPDGAVRLLKKWSEDEGAITNNLVLTKKLVSECLAGGKTAAATRILDYADSQFKEDDEFIYLRAKVYQKLGKSRERMNELQRLLERSPTPKVEEKFANLALIEWARMQKDFLLPGSTYRKLSIRLKAQPTSVDLRMVLSEVLLRRKQFDAAAEIVAQGLDSSPENPLLLARLGTCSRLQGLDSVGQSYFEQALRLDPKNQEAIRGLAKKPMLWH